MRPVTLGFLLAPLLAASGQQPPDAADERPTRDFLARLAQAVTHRSLAGIQTLDDWKHRREATRAKVLSALGLDPLPEKTPLDPVITSVFDEEKFRVATLLFKALPGFYLTANLYLPLDGKERHPAILYSCGHANDPLGAKVKYQHHPAWLASRGYVVLIVDPIQISEIEAIHHGTYRYDHWHWQALGYTPLGLEVWCSIRSIDYLVSRPDVDPERIGMTGRSGGGTMTWFTMAVDDRVRVGVTANATGLVATHVAKDTLRGHCDCAFFVNHPRIDYTDAAALCAPRPLLVQSGQKDWIYPPEGYRPLGAKAGRIYELYGADGKFKEQDVDAEHKDLPEFRTEAFRWFERWLKGTPTEEAVGDVPAIDPQKLRAVRGPLPADVRNASIAEEFPGPFTSSAPSTLAEWRDRAEAVRLRLAALTFAAEPSEAGEFQMEFPKDTAREGVVYREAKVLAEPGMPIRVDILRPEKADGAPPRAFVVVAEAGVTDLDWRPAARTAPVLKVYPRGQGGEAWSPGLVKFVRRAAPLVGRTLGTMRVTDVLRAVALAKEVTGASRVVLYGRGEGATLVLAAALREPALPVERVLLDSMPDSLLAEPILLNAARFTDVPELLSVATPRGLVFLGRTPLGFGRARQTARLHGRPGMAIRAASLAEALEEVRAGIP
jgi:dienelactone hydrolase